MELDEAIALLKGGADEDTTFEVLRAVLDTQFGWELTKRDPGPIYCDIDTGWCSVHNAWIDDHDWKLPPDPKEGWTEEQIRASTAEVKNTYRRLAQVRRGQ